MIKATVKGQRHYEDGGAICTDCAKRGAPFKPTAYIKRGCVVVEWKCPICKDSFKTRFPIPLHHLRVDADMKAARRERYQLAG